MIVTVPSFFSQILSQPGSVTRHMDFRQCCLDQAARFYGHQNIQTLPIAVQAMTDLQKSFFPILIQSDTNDFYLLLPASKKVYVARANTMLNVTQIHSLSITQVWQCCPGSLPIFTNIRELLRAAVSFFKRDLIFACLFGLLVTFMSVLVSMVSGYLISHIQEINDGSHSIIFLSLLFFFFGMAVMVYLDGIHQKMLNIKLLLFALPGVWKHLLSLPLKTMQQFSTGDISQKLFDYEIAMSSLLAALLSIVLNGVAFLGLLGYLAYFNSGLAILYLGICLLFTLVKLYYVPRNMRCINQMLVQQSTLTQYVNEMLLQINKIRSAGAESQIFKRWLKNLVLTKVHAERSMSIEILMTMIESWIPILLTLTFYLALYFLPGKMDTSMQLQFMIISTQFTTLYDKLSSRLLAMMHFLPGLQRMQSLAILEPEKFDERHAIREQIRGDLTIKNITLNHADSDNHILSDLSLHFPAGKFIAIVGRSGAGKSSIFKLLLGFERPLLGAMTLDQQPYSKFNISDIRKQFGVVLQTTNILPGTIFSNIAANHAITHDEAWRLAELVGLDAELNAMPMKMHTYISDNASESISGGQKQKILIARALASKPKILLLDEATSALDNHSQALIFKNLEALQMTRVVIAHRYSTIQHADLIYYLDDGRVKDCGSYQELVSRGVISPA